MSMPQPNSDTGLTLSGFLIIVALGTFLWKGSPLHSVRPFTDDSNPVINISPGKVNARLWHDPFSVADKSLKSKRVKRDDNVLQAKTSVATRLTHDLIDEIADSAKEGRVSVILATLDHGSYAETKELRRRFRYAILSALGEERFAPVDSSKLEILYRCKNKLNKDCDSLNKQLCNAIPYEWYEKESGYKRNKSRATSTGESENESQDVEKHKVLVVWLNESLISDSPLKTTYDFLSSILEEGEKQGKEKTAPDYTVDAFLLGPGRSATLRKLTNEDIESTVKSIRNDKKISAFNIISATATVDGDFLDESSMQNKPNRLADFKSDFTEVESCDEKNIFRGQKDKTCMRFVRTLNTDKKLIHRLVDELKQNRRIGNKKKIILISEWDSYFGRSLPEEFKNAFNGEGDTENNSNIIEYTYIRGIDGGADDRSRDEKRIKDRKRKGGTGSDRRIDEKDLRRPTGSSQYDYLRRLTEDIKEKNRNWWAEDGSSIGAVVLLGNDVYDKLLIMRALRAELPGVIFATTDLDAQMLHPAEFSWARNVIVATTYGLTPFINVVDKSTSSVKNLTIKTAPFRSSYQTSLYTATRLLFNDDMQAQGIDDISERIPEQLFEIGRQRPIPLPYQKADVRHDGEIPGVYWNKANELGKSYVLFASSIALGLILIFAYHQIIPRSAYQVITMLLLLFAFTWLGYGIMQQNYNTEPFDITSGASMWPAAYIRLLCVMLSIVFIIITLNRLRNSWIQLDYRYFNTSKTVSNGPCNKKSTFLSEITHVNFSQLIELIRDKLKYYYNMIPYMDDLPNKKVDMVLFKERVKIWFEQKENKALLLSYLFPLIMIFVLVSMMGVSRFISGTLTYKIMIMFFIWTLLVAFWWSFMYFRDIFNFEVRSVNRWFAQKYKENHSARDIWNEYREYGDVGHRFTRTIAYIIIYMAFASLVFMILGPSSAPVRGGYAFSLHMGILVHSVVLMMAVLFLVVDATRLCICWVEHINTERLSWSDSKLYDFARDLKMPANHAEAYLKIHLIGDRTSDVTRLIYYPVIIILLMLLARSTYFDNWDFPQPLAIVMTLNFIIAITSVVRLNRAAQSARNDVLNTLKKEVIAGERKGKDAGKPSVDEREKLIASLNALNIGAYRNFWDQPPVRATLMLFGGVALTYAEYIDIFL